MPFQTENMRGYQLRTGWGGFIGVLLMLPEASAHVFFMPRVGRGRRPAGRQCMRRRGTRVYRRWKPRGGKALKQARREYSVWQRTFEYSAQMRGGPAGK